MKDSKCVKANSTRTFAREPIGPERYNCLNSVAPLLGFFIASYRWAITEIRDTY